jgi:hypothetical protein
MRGMSCFRRSVACEKEEREIRPRRRLGRGEKSLFSRESFGRSCHCLWNAIVQEPADQLKNVCSVKSVNFLAIAEYLVLLSDDRENRSHGYQQG